VGSRRTWMTATAVIAVVVAIFGVYLLLADDRGVPEARAWTENHPTFEQVSQDHWQVTADRSHSLGPLDGRILPQLNNTLAQRRTVWNVPGDDFDTVVNHVASFVQHEGTPTEAFGQLWYEQPRSTIYGFRTRPQPVEDRNQSVSISVIDTGNVVEVIISAVQTERSTGS